MVKNQLALKAAKAQLSDKEFIFLEQLQEIQDSIKALVAKEPLPYPEQLPFPEMPVTDLTETNQLLKELIAKEMPEVPSFPKIDIPKVDFTETNKLLRLLLQKETPEPDMTETNNLLIQLIVKEPKEQNVTVALEII